ADRVVRDPLTGTLRPSSANFRDRNDELSVFLATETSLEKVLAGHEGFGVVAFTAGEARGLVNGAVLCRDPDPDPAHVLVCAKVSRAQAANLAKLCANRWVVQPGSMPEKESP